MRYTKHSIIRKWSNQPQIASTGSPPFMGNRREIYGKTVAGILFRILSNTY